MIATVVALGCNLGVIYHLVTIFNLDRINHFKFKGTCFDVELVVDMLRKYCVEVHQIEAFGGIVSGNMKKFADENSLTVQEVFEWVEKNIKPLKENE